MWSGMCLVNVAVEGGVDCAIDCLLQVDRGDITKTLDAWQRHIMETEEGEEHQDVQRNGMMVPEILA